MRDHDEVVKSILRKTEQYKKKQQEKKRGRKKVLCTTAGIIAIITVASIAFGMMRPQWNGENAKTTTTPSVIDLGVSENTPSVTSIPVNSEAVRPEYIYIRTEHSEESNAEVGDDLTPGDIKIGSQSLQKVMDDTRDNNLFFEIEICFCVLGNISDSNFKELSEKETAHIKEQGIYVERVNDGSVDVVISKEQLVCLEKPEDCAYWIIWSVSLTRKGRAFYEKVDGFSFNKCVDCYECKSGHKLCRFK